MGSIVLLVLTSCDGDDSSSSMSDVDAGKDATQNCRPDQLIECIGPGGCQGLQVCYVDGSGYSPCGCYGPTFSVMRNGFP